MIHSFHLAEVPARVTARTLWHPPTADAARGRGHGEYLAAMRLGAPTISPARFQLRRMALFAEWADDAALDAFLADHEIGRRLAGGWHVRLQFLRRWGSLAALSGTAGMTQRADPDEPIVAVTIARTRLTQLPRFLRWGKPVERLVRDDPATTLALAAARPPRTVSTFTVWRTARDMVEMVHGRSDVPAPDRHAVAMAERRRKDFHHEFTTLRFRPLSEHGHWQGRSSIVPGTRSTRGCPPGESGDSATETSS